MLKIEEKIVNSIVDRKEIIFFIIITVLAFMIRFAGFDFVSKDMRLYLIPWYDEIKLNGGLKGLDKQVGNYGILYQTIIATMTYFDINSIYMYKMVSVAFDYMLALTVALFVSQIKNSKILGFEFNLGYTIVLFMPTVVLNSGYWGQCDSIYTLFVFLTMASLYKEKYISAFVYLGLAFAFKLQAIFVLPAIIAYYFYKRGFSLLMFCISLITFWSTGILSYLQGGDLLRSFKVYLGQTDTYHNMWMNAPSFWVLIGNNYEFLKNFAIITTLVLCGVFLYLILSNKKQMKTLEQYLNTTTWFVWTCILFLPAMHERYTYPLDILLVILCFIDKKYIKYTILSSVLGIIKYGKYLFGNQGIDSKIYVIAYVFAWIYYSYEIIKIEKENNIEIE